MPLRRHPARGLLLVVPLTAALVLGGATPAVAAPPNDNQSSAQVLSGVKGVAYGTLVGATIEDGTCPEPDKNGTWPPIFGDRSVWFRWTAPAHGWLRMGLKTYGGWTGNLSAHRLYNGCAARPEAWASSAPGHIGQLEVRRGDVVLLAVYSSGEANIGTFALGWRFIARPAPLNDRFAAPDVLWGQYGKDYGWNLNATRDSGEPAHAGRAGGRSVWFRWTAVESGPAMFHLGGSATPRLDCLLAVYTGGAVDALTRVAADTGTWSGNSCTARFTATAGVTYRIAVDGDGGDERTFQIFWNSGRPPPHDNAANARPISGFFGVLDDTNRGATDQLDEPRHSPTRAGSSVWYRWTAPDDGAAYFSVHTPWLYQPTSEFEEFKRIAVFTGTPPAGLTLRGESPIPPEDDELGTEVSVTRGTTYWLQVTGVDEEAVHYVLGWRLQPESNDEFAEPLVLPATGSVAVDTHNTTAEPGEPSHFRYEPRRSLWFRWTAPQSGQVTFHDHAIQPALAAYTGDRLDALTRVPVTREFLADHHYQFTFPVTAGVTYRLALDEDDPFGYGDYHRLHWYFGAEDRVPPTVAVTAPADDARVSGVTQLDAAAADASGIFSVGFSHAAWWHSGPQPQPSPYGTRLDTERYRDGPLELTATAWDNQANQTMSAPRTMVIENRPPAAGISGPSDLMLIGLTDAYLRWGSDEPLSRSLCSLDGAPFTDCSALAGATGGELYYQGLADGVHVFAVRVTDMFGRTSVDPSYRQWIVDTQGLGVPVLDDTSPPTVTTPVSDLVGGTAIGSSTLPVRIRWTSSDGAGTGIQWHDVQDSVNSGAYATKTSPGAATSAVYSLSSATHRFRVRACDWAGNLSSWAYGTSFTATPAQETSTWWQWSSGWTRYSSSNASGGYYRSTGTSGAWAKLTFSGRSVAVYGPRSTSYGLSGIYLDGVRVATVNQWSATASYRQPLFVRNGLSLAATHVLEVRSLGTAGHTGGGTRVAIDAASVLH